MTPRTLQVVLCALLVSAAACGGTKTASTLVPLASSTSDGGEQDAAPKARLPAATNDKLPPQLRADAAAHYPLRTVLAVCGNTASSAAHLDSRDSECTESDSEEDAAEIELVVVEHSGGKVRVVDTMYNIRYMVYARERDMALRSGTRTRLREQPSNTAPSNVEVMSGAPTTVISTHAGWTQVGVVDAGVSVHGWLATKNLSRVYRPGALVVFADALTLRVNASMRSIVSGRNVALLEPRPLQRRLMRRTGRTHKAEIEIEVATRWLRVVGYTSPAHFSDEPSGQWEGGFSWGTWHSGHRLFMELVTGTRIHTKPSGPVYAVTTSPDGIVVATGKRRGRWLGVEFQSRWRDLSGWVLCPTLRREGRRGRCTGDGV